MLNPLGRPFGNVISRNSRDNVADRHFKTFALYENFQRCSGYLMHSCTHTHMPTHTSIYVSRPYLLWETWTVFVSPQELQAIETNDPNIFIALLKISSRASARIYCNYRNYHSGSSGACPHVLANPPSSLMCTCCKLVYIRGSWMEISLFTPVRPVISIKSV